MALAVQAVSVCPRCGSADGMWCTCAERDDVRYSVWRVWIHGDEVRVARDDYFAPPPGPRLQPEHLEEADNGRLIWMSHRQGGKIPSVSRVAFVAWLDQGGGN